MMSKWLFTTLIFATSAQAHTFVHGVWVNGVDQGTGIGVRQPPYNGPPMKGEPAFNPDSGSGSRSSPVRDLNAIDMRCHSLGDIAVPDTIKVGPNDILTFEWHHRTRSDSDQVIDPSHRGAAAVYISPNPPRDNTWVKIQEEGEGPKGTWYITGKHTQRKGKQDVRIPPNLSPGQYLLRSELFTLHEADVSHVQNPNRGIQLYIQCVQIEVTGNGTVALPVGVSFPGAYKYTDAGIVYNLYSGNTNGPLYQIPGPAVWSGAASSPSAPNYGQTKGVATQTRWSTWIGNGFSTVTARTMLTIDQGSGRTITTEYTPSWSTAYIPPTLGTTPPVTSQPPITTPPPTSTTTPVPGGGTGETVAKWGQCGGNGYSGLTMCVSGSTCVKLNDWYHQCQ